MGVRGGGREGKDPLPDFIRGGGEALYLEMFQTLDFFEDFPI